MAGGYLFDNHARSTLDGAINASATTINVASGEGSKFPASNFKVNIGTEVILIESRSGDVLTVSSSPDGRGWDGTTAAAHSDGDAILNVATAEDFATVPRDSYHDVIYRRPSGETPHAKDDEFDGLSSVNWSAYEPTGTTTWTEHPETSVLSATFQSQASSDASIYTQALDALSHPLTIETRLFQDQHAASYNMSGLCFTSGEAASSGIVCVMPYVHATRVNLDLRAGTVTNISSTWSKRQWHSTPWLWYQLIWTAENSWKIRWSPDYSLWYDGGVNNFTLSPSRMGLWVTTWSGGSLRYSVFDYFRVYESDLSA